MGGWGRGWGGGGLAGGGEEVYIWLVAMVVGMEGYGLFLFFRVRRRFLKWNDIVHDGNTKMYMCIPS